MRSKSILMAVGVLFVCSGGARALTIDLATVGNLGNADDTTGYGGVSYVYQIGTYEVTVGQYTEFLNAVADTDTYGLYWTEMWSIERSGLSGSYVYSADPNCINRPVHEVSWGDAARFANWLHNGQPNGLQGLTTTEDGSYYLNGATGKNELNAVIRKADATWVLPTQDEWYKAAYHKNDGVTGNYFYYPTGSDSVPSNDFIDPDPGNNATFYDGVQPDPAGYTIGSPYYFTVVGAHENSQSPYGTFDMGGNVKEWLESRYSTGRSIRGGSYTSSEVSLRSSSVITRLPYVQGNDVGFRVAFVPHPCYYVVAGDLNDDCRVELIDFAQLASNWQISYDINDLAEMAANWLINCNVNPGDPSCVPK